MKIGDEIKYTEHYLNQLAKLGASGTSLFSMRNNRAKILDREGDLIFIRWKEHSMYKKNEIIPVQAKNYEVILKKNHPYTNIFK
jgi:hypothetical protein